MRVALFRQLTASNSSSGEARNVEAMQHVSSTDLSCPRDRSCRGESGPNRCARLTTVLTFLAVLLAIAFCLSRDDADPDLWGHVQFGKDRLAAGIPRETTYSYTSLRTPWINHELVAETFYAVVETCLGSHGLLAWKLVLACAVAGLWLTRNQRDGVQEVVLFATSLAAALALANYWTVRPQLFSYFAFALLLSLLGHAFRGWEGRIRPRWPRPRPEERTAGEAPYRYNSRNMRTLWLAPILMAAWANTHGAFVAGLAFYIAYLGGRAGEAYWLRGQFAWGHIRRFSLMAMVAIVATCFQPYGLRLHVWLYSALGVPRPEITEWHPPDFTSPTGWPLLVLLGLFVFAAVLSRRPRDPVQWCLLAGLAVQALTHERHIPFFVLAWVFWLPPHVQSAWQQLRRASGRVTESPPGPTQAVMLSLACLLLAGSLWPKLGPIKVPKDRYPVDAVQFLAERDWSGKIVVTYDWAQYVLATLGARYPGDRGLLLALDGRFRTAYTQEQIDAHFDFILGNIPSLRYRGSASPAFDPTRTLQTGYPDLVLISRRQPHAVAVMESQSDWELLYQDGLAQLWGRANRFGDPRSPDYLPPSKRRLSDSPPAGWSAWPAAPPRKTERQRGRRPEIQGRSHREIAG